ncbi:MAG: hypothetical protein B9S38_02360 [Verrucomicrobiia bacterium Tous-C4TDCM]|nr:MAG: hypothetical protein B9S38_02360 [Verrucomicrobiae bacterium Tous-C4TDCM]
MNTRIFTGYIPADAEGAYSPATATAPAQPRLIFEVITRNSRKIEYPEKCVIDDPALIAEYRDLCTTGRVVLVQGEGTARPYYERDRIKGYVRETIVTHMEFPDRSKRKQEDPS